MAAQYISITVKGIFNGYYEGSFQDKALICVDADDPTTEYYCWIHEGFEKDGSTLGNLTGETMLVSDAIADGWTFEPEESSSGSPDDTYEDGDFIKFKLPPMYDDFVDFSPEFDGCYVGQIKNTSTTYAFVQMYHADGKMGPRIPFFNLVGKVATTKLDYYPIPKSLVDIKTGYRDDPEDPESPIILDSDDSEIWMNVVVGAGESPEIGVPYVMKSNPSYDEGFLVAVYSDGSLEPLEESSYTVTPVEGDTVVMVEDPETGYCYVPGTVTYEGLEKITYVGFVETK